MIRIIPIGHICFYVFWLTLLLGKAFGITGAELVFQYITFAVLPLALSKILISKWYRKELINIIALNLLGLIIFIFSGDASVCLSIIVITSCKDMDIYRIFKISFWTLGIIFFIRTSLAILGIADKQYTPRIQGGTIDNRYALGYNQPNATHYTLFVVTVLLLITYNSRMKIYHYLMLFIYNIIIYKYTVSRTGVIMVAAAIILCYLSKKKAGAFLRYIIAKYGKYSYIFASTLSIVISFILPKLSFLKSFGTLSSRFVSASNIIYNKSLSLFGIRDVKTDFGFINLLYGSGVIFYGLFIVGNTVLLNKCAKYNKTTEEIILILYAVYTCSEAYSTSILMNASLFLFYWIVFCQKVIPSK